nr:F-box/WD repeat-containing protein sel-10-like [Ipomoea batatas]GME09942.1 F-box/WD repeat-containing protein sel-10-like [Ipomoea batatas]
MANASLSTQPQDDSISITDLDVDALVNCAFRLCMAFILQKAVAIGDSFQFNDP